MTTPEVIEEKPWYAPEDAEFIDGAWRPKGTYVGNTETV